MSETLNEQYLGVQRRAFSFEKHEVNDEQRSIELSFSSELPYERSWGIEVLDHSPESCDLSLLRNSAPLLLEHDPKQQIGVVETAQISADKRGRAVVRFSRSALGQEIYQDVRDGIRKLTSVGYEIIGAKEDGTRNGKRVLRAKWVPFEISIVSIPVDSTVGVGRNKQITEMSTQTESAPPASGTAGAAAAPAPTVNVQEIRSKELERIQGIMAVANQHRAVDLADTFIKKGASVEEFASHVLQTRYKATPVTPAESKPEIGMSEKEKRSYSLVRAISILAAGKELDGLEREASEAVAKKTRNAPKGFFIPADVSGATFRRAPEEVRQNRALNVNSQSAGGYLVDTGVQWGSMVELLRNSMIVTKLGARVLSGLVGNVAVPKHTGGATAYWLSETEEVTASQQTFGQLYLVPHRLGARTAFTKQLLSQSSIDVEALVREDLMAVLALEKDRAAINGLGADGEPLGLLNTTGINSLTFGGAPTWTDAVDFEKLVEDDNVPFDGTEAYVTTPVAKAKWKTTEAFSSTGVVLWKDNMVNGRPAFSTKQVPSDKMIFGKWSDLIIADWDGIDVVVDNITLASTGQIQIIIHMLTDNGVRNAVSFAASSDSAAQ